MFPRFLALGDSYTIGEGVRVAERWPVQLVGRLREGGIDVGNPQILARTGWTTDELAAAMDATAFAPSYALVTLMIGVNDHYRGRQPGEYRSGFRVLLQRAIALAGGADRVVVVSIPDWGVTPFARNEAREPALVAAQIDAFNAAAHAEAHALGAHWVDVTTISRASGTRDRLVADGLHPSDAQYTQWVDAILPVARAALCGGGTKNNS